MMSYKFWLNLIIKYPERVVVVILIIIILLQRACQHDYVEPVQPLPKQPVKLITYTPLPDKLPVSKLVYIKYKDRAVPVPVEVTKKIHDTVYLDTSRIVLNYMGMVAYNDTLMNTDDLFILLQDTLQYNLIKSRKPTIRFKPVFKPIEPRRALYGGLGVGGDLNAFRPSARLLYKDKKDRIFGIGYYPLGKGIEITIYYKIKLRK